jgi:hypothetical protein
MRTNYPRRCSMSKRDRTVFLIGFDEEDALMYSKTTSAYDIKVPFEVIEVLCNFAGVRPKTGELW